MDLGEGKQARGTPVSLACSVLTLHKEWKSSQIAKQLTTEI